jgi:hypothetical protein
MFFSCSVHGEQKGRVTLPNISYLGDIDSKSFQDNNTGPNTGKRIQDDTTTGLRSSDLDECLEWIFDGIIIVFVRSQDTRSICTNVE